VSSDDRALLPRAPAGDGEALESRVYRLAFGITRSTGVQDVFLQICQKGGGFEGQAAPGGWIYRGAHA